MAYPRTPEEITSAWLAGVLDVDEADIESVSVDFVGDAIGNTSDVYFVRITSRGSANLPQSLVAKMVPRFEGAVGCSGGEELGRGNSQNEQTAHTESANQWVLAETEASNLWRWHLAEIRNLKLDETFT